MVPDGVFLDMDGLAEVDLGNGTNYNPAEALNMYFQTGSILGRSMTTDGDPNPGRIPIQELRPHPEALIQGSIHPLTKNEFVMLSNLPLQVKLQPYC